MTATSKYAKPLRPPFRHRRDQGRSTFDWNALSRPDEISNQSERALPFTVCLLLYFRTMASSNDSSIRLYAYVTSPYAMKVHCYLLYKQLPFKVLYVNPLRLEKELPVGKQVPVLQINKDARRESSAIGAWLDETFPDTARLIPQDVHPKREVLQLDQWITDILIPTTFFSVYPRMDAAFVRSVSNTMRLGYCVSRTTSGLPFGIRFLWPLFIRNAGFIRRMVAPIAAQGTVRESRNIALSYLEEKLQGVQYLAGTDDPSLADFGAWPSLVVPYRLKLKGFDDFKGYANVSRWVDDISPLMVPSEHAPPLIPEALA